MGSTSLAATTFLLATIALATHAEGNKTGHTKASKELLWLPLLQESIDADGQATKRPIKRQSLKIDFDKNFAKYQELASRDRNSNIVHSRAFKESPGGHDPYEALKALAALPRALVGSTPASYAYFMQMHPAKDGPYDNQRSVRIFHFHPLSKTLTDANVHDSASFRDNIIKDSLHVSHPSRAQQDVNGDEKYNPLFDGLPFARVQVPASFLYANPLATRIKKPTESPHSSHVGAFKKHQTSTTRLTGKDTSREPFRRLPDARHSFQEFNMKNLPLRLDNTKDQLNRGPQHVSMEIHSAPIGSKFSTFDELSQKGALGQRGKSSHFKTHRDATASNFNSPANILGSGRYSQPGKPHVREYDPYSNKFRTVATADAHDSKERYSPPTQTEESDSREAKELTDDFALQKTQTQPGLYEVNENHFESLADQDYKGMKTGYKTAPDFTSAMKSTEGLQPVSKLKTKEVPYYNSKFIRHQSPRYESPGEQYIANLHRPRGRKRPRPKHRTRAHLEEQSAGSSSELSVPNSEERVPIFEFKNPVFSMVSGYRSLGPTSDIEDEGSSGNEGENRGENIEDQSVEGELGAGVPEHHASSEAHLEEGDGEAEALNEEDTKKRFPEDDDKVFGSFEVFHSQLDPSKGEFKPFVRYPFETERGKLKTMVDDLLKAG